MSAIEYESKVPILGDMPLIGRLFRSTSNTTKKQNLMVFIHPVVIDGDAIANKLSRESITNRCAFSR